MSSAEAPDASASGFVIASMIRGTESSVTPAAETSTSTHGISIVSLVPGLGIATPPVRVMAFDDHPRVRSQLGCVEHVEQRLGHARDQLLLDLGGQAPLEQLDPDERHRYFSTCCDPPSGPSTRSSDLSGTWSSGTGASASMNVTPPSEYSLWCRPRLITTTSPVRTLCVSSSIVISTSPSRTNITC